MLLCCWAASVLLGSGRHGGGCGGARSLVAFGFGSVCPILSHFQKKNCIFSTKSGLAAVLFLGGFFTWVLALLGWFGVCWGRGLCGAVYAQVQGRQNIVSHFVMCHPSSILVVYFYL